MVVYIIAILCALLGLVIGFLIGTNTYSPMRSRITAEIISRMRDAMKSLCYDKAHDHLESVDTLSMAAASYAIVDMDEQQSKTWWPWSSVHYKPKDRLRNLVRAGALIAAAIDRLQEKQ